MDLNKVRQLASRVTGAGIKRIKVVDAERCSEAITRDDVRQLMKEGALVKKGIKGTSRGRARTLRKKKKAGRRRGPGSRKGSFKTRAKPKMLWMRAVRSQRKRLKELRPKNYRKVYKMVKGGFFKSVKHLEEYVTGGK